MEEDDDMFLVIIENENGEDVKFPLPIITKQEPLDETEPELAVKDIIDTVEKHGQFIDIEIPPICNEYEYLEDEDYPDDEVFEEKPDIEILQENPVLIEKYLPRTKNGNNKSNVKMRRSMLKPEEQKSFVMDLKDQYPELRVDSKLLVRTLAVIMKNVKPPPPPKDYCVEVDEVFQCTDCDTWTESVAAAKRHYQEKHGPRYLMCYACGVDFRSVTNLYKHEKRCTAPDATIVLQARAICIGSKGRSRPYLSLRRTAPPKYPLSKFNCQLCSASFNTKHNLTSHEYMHKGERPFQCHACPAAYTSNSALLRHVQKHSDVEYVCDHCGRAFKLKMALVAHMDTHQPQRKYGCGECERRFAQKSSMKLHVDRVHRNLPPPCACQICPKRYPRMSLLKKHMKKEHGLVIMTRKMFFKKLPMLSSDEVQQVAKLVFRSDSKLHREDLDFDLPYDDQAEETSVYGDASNSDEPAEIIVPDNLSSEDFIELLNKFECIDHSNRDKNKMVIIDNCQMTNVDPVFL